VTVTQRRKSKDGARGKSLALSQLAATKRAEGMIVVEKAVPLTPKYKNSGNQVFLCDNPGCYNEFVNSLKYVTDRFLEGKEPCNLCRPVGKPGACRVETSIFGVCPEIAGSFHPTKNKGQTASTIPARSRRTVWWECHIDHSHGEWQEPVYSRTSRAGCLQCTSLSGTSKQEIAIRKELVSRFDFHPSEGTVAHNGQVWKVDAIHHTKRFVVEFDGSYWHGDKFPDKRGTDIRKTKELLKAGYRVLRVRHDLPNLNVRNAHSMHLKHRDVYDLNDLAQRVAKRVEKLL
jgi:very-short-patch-repair endonuclease